MYDLYSYFIKILKKVYHAILIQIPLNDIDLSTKNCINFLHHKIMTFTYNIHISSSVKVTQLYQ
jgi:hypothetical protein